MIDLSVLIRTVCNGNLKYLKILISLFKKQRQDLGEDELVSILTEHVNKEDGKTLLHYAAEKNHLNIVNYLLSFNGVFTSHPDKNRNNFLCYLYLNGKMNELLPESIKEIKKTFPSFDPINRNTWMYNAMSKKALFKLYERTTAEDIKTSLLNLPQQMAIPDLPPATASPEEFKKNILMRVGQQVQAEALLASLSDSNQL